MIEPSRKRIERAGERIADRDAAEIASKALLRASGIEVAADPDPALTPRRFARALDELLTPRDFDFTTFENVEEYDEMVLVRNIPMQSLCEHRLLPFPELRSSEGDFRVSPLGLVTLGGLG